MQMLLGLALSLDGVTEDFGLSTIEYPFVLQEIFEKGFVSIAVDTHSFWEEYLGMEL